MNEVAARGRPFPPGTSGNPNGRPVGSRTAFSAAFLRDLGEAWAEHGLASMHHTAKSNPEVFFATCARILPRDVQLTVQQHYSSSLDERDLRGCGAIRDSMPGAKEMEPQAVLEPGLSAIRAYDASPVIDGVCDSDTREKIAKPLINRDLARIRRANSLLGRFWEYR